MEILRREVVFDNVVDFFIAHIKILNIFLPQDKVLTEAEIKLMGNFLKMPGEQFSPKNKKEVKEVLGLSDTAINGHILRIRKKGFIVEKEDGLLEILQMFKANLNGQGYEVKYTL